MAVQDEVTAPTPELLYLSSLPTPNGNIAGQSLTTEQAAHSLYQIQVNPGNPAQAALVPAPGADGRMLGSLSETVFTVFDTRRLPASTDRYLTVEQPTLLEKIGDNWKVMSKGRVGFSPTAPEPVQLFVPRLERAPEAPAQGQSVSPALAAPGTDPAPELNHFQVAWKQVNDEGAPLAKIVKLLNFERITLEKDLVVTRGEDGKLSSKLAFQYDPANVSPERVEGIIAGLNQVGAGNGLLVYENHEQQRARSSSLNDNVQVTAIRNELAREITPGREWPQDSQHLDQFIKATAAPEAPKQSAQNERPAAAEPATRAEVIAEQLVALPQTQAQAVPAPVTPVADEPVVASGATPRVGEGVGELQIRWRQQGDQVAPLTEMRAYLDSLQELGVAVGAMKFERGEDGKLSGSFGVSYDPNAPDLTKLEGAVQGLKKVGNGLEVVEAPEQAVARRQGLGHEGQDKALDLAFPVREAFGIRQWDSLSAQLSQAPRQALTGPEQAQQAAGIERVKQVARQQGKTNEQIIQDGKSLLDIDTSGNPVSAFLKNFYEHLNGAPKTRQSLEVDYEATRQELQARLLRQAGNAEAPTVVPSPAQAVSPAPAPRATAPATGAVAAGVVPAPTVGFTAEELPKDKLALFGLTPELLARNGQLQKLLSGERTDLLTLKVAGWNGQGAMQLDGKLLLYREANGSVTLKIDLPRHQLEIPNEIGGQPFTPEQRQRLEKEGTAGLVRGLRDEQGNVYNGYVGVDKAMNTLVILPEKKVAFKDEIAGVKLTPEQSHNLREGKAVHLAQMRRVDGGKPFDGTAQIIAAKAGVEVKPEPYELARKQAPQAVQQRDLDTIKRVVPARAEQVMPGPPTQNLPKQQPRGLRP